MAEIQAQVVEEKASKTVKVTFLPEGKTVEVNLKDFPYGDHGEPGSILDIALEHGIELDHACGGVCACSTCHVIFRKGGEHVTEQEDEEADQLDMAPGVELESRLGCQAVLRGTGDVVVEIPVWNRNLAREGAQ